MSNGRTIGQRRKNLESMATGLEQLTLNSIRKILPDRAIEQACQEAGYRYRRRTLTPIVTVLHMILTAIWPEESFQAGWQVLWDHMVSRCPHARGQSPSSGSVAKARARLPLSLWKRLFAWLSQQAQQQAKAVADWRGHRVVLLDGTSVSMPDTPALQKAFGGSRGCHGRSRDPLARLVTLSLAKTMTVLSYAVGPYKKDETVLAQPLLKDLQDGDLLIADRHFAGAHFYARYVGGGLEFLTRVHQRLKISRLKPLWRNSRFDFVAEMPVGKAYQRQDPSLPKRIRVRLIRATVMIRGRRSVIWLVTSLLDAKRYPAREIVELYMWRWRIETLFREVKIDLSADVLRSHTPSGVRKEIIARLLAVNIVHLVILEAAEQHQIDPVRISFAHALRAIVMFAPALAMAPAWQRRDIYQAMLTEIADNTVPRRPGRNEPRAVRREPKNYPSLRCTRKQWKLIYAA